MHCLPVGNAGNITAYWKGYREYHAIGRSTRLPRMLGWQAAGLGAHRARRAGVASRDDRHRHPHRQPGDRGTARSTRATSPAATIGAVTDAQILEAYRLLASEEGCFVEPASAASVAGLFEAAAAGRLTADDTVVCTVTGHGLKDPQRAIAEVEVSDTIGASTDEVAAALDLLA